MVSITKNSINMKMLLSEEVCFKLKTLCKNDYCVKLFNSLAIGILRWPPFAVTKIA